MPGKVADRWLNSGKPACLCGHKLMPQAHPFMPDTASCVTRGQATSYPLKQEGSPVTWVLKKFTRTRCPSRDYTERVAQCLPGGTEFVAGAQRRVVQVARRASGHSLFHDTEFAEWLDGTVLMTRVPGDSWADVADMLREGERIYSRTERLTAALGLATCVNRLELSHCAHRDLSATNLFLDDHLKVFLIDWDSMHHPHLPYQPNTTVGTMGYIAPFMRRQDGTWDARLSWRCDADRLALSVLLTEILLVDQNSRPSKEDGSHFSQAEIGDPTCEFARAQANLLRGIFPPLSPLFHRAVSAADFADCPAPGDWIGVLKTALSEAGRSRASIRVNCACHRCGNGFQIAKDKLDALLARQKPVLCPDCFRSDTKSWVKARVQRDHEYPEIVCEHCGATARIRRAKLEVLRAKGKPILCRTCLERQLDVWQEEQRQRDHDYPQFVCSSCGTTRRLPREKLSALKTKHRTILCLNCLKQERERLSAGNMNGRPIITSIPF